MVQDSLMGNWEMVVAVRVVGICIGKYDLRVDGRRFVLCTQSCKTILSLPLVPQPLPLCLWRNSILAVRGLWWKSNSRAMISFLSRHLSPHASNSCLPSVMMDFSFFLWHRGEGGLVIRRGCHMARQVGFAVDAIKVFNKYRNSLGLRLH